jgi:hypothetical protein
MVVVGAGRFGGFSGSSFMTTITSVFFAVSFRFCCNPATCEGRNIHGVSLMLLVEEIERTNINSRTNFDIAIYKNLTMEEHTSIYIIGVFFKVFHDG